MSTRLSKHIESLLSRHSCVVVPGLGGFVLEVLPARLDREEHLAYPPSAALRFNEELTHHDGLLEQRYAHVYGISTRRGRIMIEEDVRALRAALVRSRRYHLPSLGWLQLSEEGILSFRSEASGILSGVSYGLSPVALTTHSAKGQAPTEQSVAQGAERSYIQVRIPKRAVAWGATAAAIVLAFLPWSRSGESREHFTASFVPNEVSVTQLWGSEAMKLATPVQEAEPTSVWVEPEVGKYYVIIASERSEARAMEHYDKAQSEGLLRLEILKGAKMHRLSAGSFASSAEAYTYLNQIVARHKAAWVYTPAK